jgi:hypothetical protein
MANTTESIALATERLRELEDIGREVVNEQGETHYTLADAIRSGSRVSGQSVGWSDESDNLCAMSAALADVRARGL